MLNPLSGIIEVPRRDFGNHSIGRDSGFDRDRCWSAHDGCIFIPPNGTAVRRRYLIPMLPMIKVRGVSKRYVSVSAGATTACERSLSLYSKRPASIELG